MDTWLEALREFGFPVAVCAWFMFRTEKIINKNTEAIRSLAEIIKNLRRKK